MPRYAQVEKRVRGKRLTQREFRKLIVEKIAALQEHHNVKGVRARQIAEALCDPAWVEPANLQLINQTLVNLKAQHILLSEERGLYGVNAAKIEMGLDQQDEYEIMMGDVLEKHGGFCTAKDLLDGIGAERGDGTWTIAYKVLASSEVIRKDYAIARPGLYNLSPERLANLPLMGKWARLQFLYGYRIVSGEQVNTIYDDADDEIDVLFKRVGRAFRRALEVSGEDAVQIADDNRKFWRALKTMAGDYQDWQGIKAQALAVYDKTGPKGVALAAKGWTYDEIEDARDDAEKRWTNDWPWECFDRFLAGDRFAHLAAPLTLYTSFAEWGFLDVAQLSRGLLIWNLEKTERLKRQEAAAPAYHLSFPDEPETLPIEALDPAEEED